MNQFLWPTLAAAVSLAWAGWAVTRWSRRPMAVAMVSLLACLPCVLYAIHYLHVLDGQAWFYRLRSLPASELFAAGAGWTLGAAAAVIPPGRSWLRIALAVSVAGLITTPYLKPVLLPLDRSLLTERWDAGVCLQSTGSTCGPASAATVLRQLGLVATEAELAEECHTASTGTEAWFLVRALRRRGCTVTIRTDASLEDVVPPAIAGIRLASSGHFIAVLGREARGLDTGDPLVGRRIEDPDRISRRRATGFVLEIRR